jgi:hypothetical protein
MGKLAASGDDFTALCQAVCWYLGTSPMDGTGEAKKRKGPEFGLHQAKRLCQLPERGRLTFIADGLPIILDSAQGFWKASQELRRKLGDGLRKAA